MWPLAGSIIVQLGPGTINLVTGFTMMSSVPSWGPAGAAGKQRLPAGPLPRWLGRLGVLAGDRKKLAGTLSQPPKDDAPKNGAPQGSAPQDRDFLIFFFVSYYFEWYLGIFQALWALCLVIIIIRLSLKASYIVTFQKISKPLQGLISKITSPAWS